MSNKGIGIILAFIMAAVVGVLYFLMNEDVQKKGEVTGVLLPNTAFVIKVNHPGDLLKKMATNKNTMWKSLEPSSIFHKLITNFDLVDSILSDHPSLKQAVFSEPFFVATSIDRSGEFHTLLVGSLTGELNPEKLYAFLTDNFTGLKVELVHADMLRLLFDVDTVYLRLSHGLITASREQALLLDRKKTTKDAIPEELKSFLKNATEKTDARLYINYPLLNNLLNDQLTDRGKNLIQFFADIAESTETDVKIKNKEILFSGFTAADSSHTFLSSFNGQEPLPNKVINIIPYNTILLVNQCFSDFKSYADRAGLADPYGLVNETGNEVTFVNNAGKGDELLQQFYAVIHLANGAHSRKALEKIASGKKKNYEHYVFRKINDKEFLKKTYGEMFGSITGNWFVFIEDYAVFANSTESLENFIRLYTTGKTLDLNDNFKTFSDDISSKSNVLVYLKPEALISYAGLFTDKKTAEKLAAYEDNLAGIQGLVLQYSAGKERMYTSFFMKQGDQTKEENLALWKVELNENIYGKPALVWDHRTKTYNTIVFDVMSNMYLISNRGQIQWKKRVDGPPLSEIYEVDYYKNGKTQYLFNTKDFIYLIDRNGDFVKGYPIKINPAATNGLSLFDYKNNKDYRLMIAQADKFVYNYTLKGKKVQGWKKPKTKDIVKDRIYRIVANGKDYFIIPDISDNILIVNRRGEKRIKLKGNLEKARYSAFYPNKTNSKGIIITTDKKGRLVYITSSGKIAYTVFGDFSPAHFFLYGDFDGNRTSDFLFLDGKELKVFDRFKKLLFSYTFDADITEKPVIFDLGKKRKALGVVSSAEKTIYLFDQSGHTIISRGLVGETPFTIGSVNNDRELNLITASGNVLYNYRIK